MCAYYEFNNCRFQPTWDLMIVDLPELMRVMGYIREALIKSVHGEPAKPRTDELPLILRISRSPFDKLSANGRLNQSFLR